jgi:hypothetical protein
MIDLINCIIVHRWGGESAFEGTASRNIIDQFGDKTRFLASHQWMVVPGATTEKKERADEDN